MIILRRLQQENAHDQGVSSLLSAMLLAAVVTPFSQADRTTSLVAGIRVGLVWSGRVTVGLAVLLPR